MDKSKWCKHCLPYKHKWHIHSQLTQRVDSFLGRLPSIFPESWKISVANLLDRVWVYLLFFLQSLRIVKFESNPNRSQLFNRSLIFFDEAKDRGIDIKAVSIFGYYLHDFIYTKDSKIHGYSHIPVPHRKTSGKVDDKSYVKKKLDKKSLPVPTGRSFSCKHKAFEYGISLGFPLVVKPQNGSLSKHVTTNIQTEKELKKAVNIAKEYGPHFVVEKYIPGNLYRATVIGTKHVFVCQKEAANIVGDKRRSIKELIISKNRNPKRKGKDCKNTTLHKISLHDAHDFLKNTQYTLASIPSKNEKVVLSNTLTLSAGCDIIECTQKTHQENKSMFRRAAKTLNADLVGFDFICPDISRSWEKMKCGILEANSRPYVDMHANPSEGTPQPVAAVVWDTLLKN